MIHDTFMQHIAVFCMKVLLAGETGTSAGRVILGVVQVCEFLPHTKLPRLHSAHNAGG
jgi:hypothetical protein